MLNTNLEPIKNRTNTYLVPSIQKTNINADIHIIDLGFYTTLYNSDFPFLFRKLTIYNWLYCINYTKCQQRSDAMNWI
jgi:hypothetical protein